MTDEIEVPPEVTDPSVQAIGYTLEEKVTILFMGERRVADEGTTVPGTLCEPGEYTTEDIHDFWWENGAYPALRDGDTGTIYVPLPGDKVGEASEKIFWMKEAIEVDE
ncbi:hypothetical protein [Halosimplex marinum]|uniref:hypothetical protein n=1 Tax=Halosimplex marinum TaxID=3396620 RepID=UPI003F580227